MAQSPVAVYLHTPFCPSKCGYCDFNSYAMSGEIVERTVSAIEKEVLASPWRGRPAKTVFFGGGTPTFLSGPQLARLLRAVFSVHPLLEGAEVTSEANPGTADAEKFAFMRGAGFNRLSLGAQSFQSHDLIQLGRIHEASDVARAVSMARRAGFENVNLDLMFALPGQSPRGWQKNLETAFSLNPEHLSLYCLTIEPNTRFHRYAQRGMLDLPDEESQVQMYDAACSMARAAGYQQYEISNFCKAGFESRHNLCYWRGEEYLGYGPGAVGCVGTTESRTRYTVMKHPQRYCEAIEAGSKLWCETEELGPKTQELERLMLGLRLNEGLEAGSVSVEKSGFDKSSRAGWVELEGGRIRLTPAGRHFCSEVVAELAT